MHDDVSPPFDAFMGSIPTASPSAYSAFDVVLDDGTLQRRTISLSTLPDELDEQEEDDDEEEEDATPNQYYRQQLRKERYRSTMGSPAPCMLE